MRIAAYAVISVSFVYNALDDFVRGRRTDIVWLALAFNYIVVLGLLALDLGDIVAWIDARAALTIPATIAALAVSWQTGHRILDQRRLQRIMERQNGSNKALG